MKKIETRKDEIRFLTNDPKKMIGRFIAKRVLKTWIEDFLDEDNGEVVPLERNEVLFDAGTYIDNETLASIRFYIADGSITQIEVSNQRRIAKEWLNTSLSPYYAKVLIGKSKYKFLFYASSIDNALIILKDYIELNYQNGFLILEVKQCKDNVILSDNFTKEKEDNEDVEEKEKKGFFTLDVKLIYDDQESHDCGFIVETYNVEKALTVITQYIKNKQNERAIYEAQHNREYIFRDFTLSINKATPLSANIFISKEFSQAYNQE